MYLINDWCSTQSTSNAIIAGDCRERFMIELTFIEKCFYCTVSIGLNKVLRMLFSPMGIHQLSCVSVSWNLGHPLSTILPSLHSHVALRSVQSPFIHWKRKPLKMKFHSQVVRVFKYWKQSCSNKIMKCVIMISFQGNDNWNNGERT